MRYCRDNQAGESQVLLQRLFCHKQRRRFNGLSDFSVSGEKTGSKTGS